MFRLGDLLFPPRGDEMLLRGARPEDMLDRMVPRLVERTWPPTVTLLPFADPLVRSALHEAKYHGNATAFDLLAGALADYLEDADDLANSKRVIVVPIPLGPTRQKERGFNQVHEVVQRALTRLSREEISLDTSLLTRVRETPTQVGLAREKREKNLEGAFVRTHPLDPHPTYLVVDDVITTGATLSAALDALRADDTLNLVPLALAH